MLFDKSPTPPAANRTLGFRPINRKSKMPEIPEHLIAELTSRGMVQQTTNADALTEALRDTRVIYCGFDATAESLHVGHLATLTFLRRLHAAGHRIIVALGTATAQVGDPSFRDKSRPPLTAEQVQANAAGIRAIVERVLAGCDPLIVDNREWLEPIGHLAFMHMVGGKFTLNRMLSFEAVKSRMASEQSMTFLEFGYTLLQALDFSELFRRFGCTIQVGGSDQWANIINGIDLARSTHGAELHGLTTPLLAKANGEKMGKSVGGAVWLDRTKTSIGDHWQFWRNVDDRDVAPLLLRLTSIEPDRVAEACGSSINEAKALLADAMTELVHGHGALREARASTALFLDEGAPDPDLASEAVHSTEPSRILVELGLCTSLNEGRRLVKQGGVRIDGHRVGEAEVLVPGRHVLIVGKKRRKLIEVV